MATSLFPEFHVIIVPGLHDSSPAHWQSRWQRRGDFARVRQDDWERPHLPSWAARWNSELVEAGRLGHINADSGLGAWPFGAALLRRLADRAHNAVSA